MGPGFKPRCLGLTPEIFFPRWSDASLFLPGSEHGDQLSGLFRDQAFPGCGTFSVKIRAALGKLGRLVSRLVRQQGLFAPDRGHRVKAFTR